MTDPQILLEQILREVIKPLIIRPKPIRRRDPTHTRHLMHIHQRPAPRKPGPVLPIDEHHPRHDSHIMLPAMPELMPPLALNNFILVDLIDGPEIAVRLVQKDGLEDMVLVGYGRFVGVVVQPELVLVICAVERHFDFLHVLGVRMRVVHGSVPARLTVLALLLVLGEGDLLLLLLVFGRGAEGGVEMSFVVLGKVLRIRVRDCDVVEEAGAAEDEPFAPGSCFTEEGLGVVGKNAHDEVVECFCFGLWT